MCVHDISDTISEERARQLLEHVRENEQRQAAERARKLLRKADIAARNGNSDRRDNMLQLARDAAAGLPEHLSRDITEGLQAFETSISAQLQHVSAERHGCGGGMLHLQPAT